MSNLIERSQFLLRNIHFFTLASSPSTGTAWATTLNYVTGYDPLRLIWYSMSRAAHSEHIRQHPCVSGSIFFTDKPELSFVGLDGAQFTGTVREIGQTDCQEIHQYYYENNFPDIAVRELWLLPLHEFYGEGKRRFYELSIDQWWLLDLDGWKENKEDQRIPVPLELITLNNEGRK